MILSFRWLSLSLLLGVLLSGCVDRQGLLDPDGDARVAPADAPRLTFSDGADSLFLHEGDRIAIDVVNDGSRHAQVQVFLLDEARNILWRSDYRSAGGEETLAFPISNLPSSLPRGSQLLVTASMEGSDGARYYATDDTVAEMSLESAAVRSVFIYDGQFLPIESGDVQSLAPAADHGRVFYANAAGAEVGAVDLTQLRLDRFGASIGSAPSALDYRAGKLAVLAGDGAQVSVFRVSGTGVFEESRNVIPSLFLRITQATSAPDSTGDMESITVDVPVRPYARSISLGCVPGYDGGCTEATAYGPSGVAGSEGRGVLRKFALGTGKGLPVVLPYFQLPIARYQEGTEQDTLPAEIAVISGTPPVGTAEVLESLSQAARCFSLQLGAGPVVASPLPGGPVFAAVDEAATLCGDGTRLVRVDKPESDSAHVNLQAMRNLLGEDRIGPIQQMKISADGQKLLLLGEDVVYVLDDMLRLVGKVKLAGARSVAWLQEASVVSSDRFAVANARGVQVFESVNLTRIGSLAIGPTKPFLMSFIRAPKSSDYMVVAAAQDHNGFLVAHATEDDLRRRP